MKKVNLGCGSRYARGWINLDYSSNHPDVIPHNLLKPLPFDDEEIDVIYSSHVLEHLSRSAGQLLIRNCYKKLKPGGVLRIVVPDLENVCREYLNILDNITENKNDKKYEWIIIELLDQLVRTETGGQMAAIWPDVVKNNEQFLINYIDSRRGVEPRSTTTYENRSILDKVKSMNINKIRTRLLHFYIGMVKLLLPKTLRNTVLDNTSIGEKHKWMYDKYSLSSLLKKTGFKHVEFLDAETSKIDNFANDFLDTNPDGSHHKESSIYCEATK